MAFSYIKDKTLLFSAYQAKMVNCVSASATEQHIEAPNIG